MSIEQQLMQRANSECEFCGADHGLQVYEVPPHFDSTADQAVLVCQTCYDQIAGSSSMNANHWHCLNDAMWKPKPVIQVMAWRLLTRLNAEGWASDLLDILYLEDDVQQWAESMPSEEAKSTDHKDSNGAALLAGDSVTLIKDLDVKGANFTAKRGTMVKNISLTDNPEQIEGRVNGTRIVLLTKFLKKVN